MDKKVTNECNKKSLFPCDFNVTLAQQSEHRNDS